MLARDASRGRLFLKSRGRGADRVEAAATGMAPGAAVIGFPGGREAVPRAPDSPSPLGARASCVRDDLDALKAFLALHLSPDGAPTIESVARAARCSVRTVQRRLEEAGETFSGLLDEVRLEVAAGMLADEGRGVGEIAFDLGYSDQANFTRAFRRWAGVTPSAYRRLQADRQKLAG